MRCVDRRTLVGTLLHCIHAVGRDTPEGQQQLTEATGKPTTHLIELYAPAACFFTALYAPVAAFQPEDASLLRATNRLVKRRQVERAHLSELYTPVALFLRVAVTDEELSIEKESSLDGAVGSGCPLRNFGSIATVRIESSRVEE